MTNNDCGFGAPQIDRKAKLIEPVCFHAQTLLIKTTQVIHCLADSFVHLIADYKMIPMTAYQLRYARPFQLHYV